MPMAVQRGCLSQAFKYYYHSLLVNIHPRAAGCRTMASTYIVVIFQMSLPAVKGSVAARPTRQIKIPHFSSLFDICGDT